MARAAAGTLAANRANAATRWRAYTYDPVGIVASVVGFKLLVDSFEQAANGSVTGNLHFGRQLADCRQ
jgi:hypothetical protein